MNNKGELMPGGTVARPGKSDKYLVTEVLTL
jgi:hypothetical protein